MTPALHIANARTRLHTAAPIAPERLAAWTAEFANQDGEALARRWVEADEWLLIRRLPLRARWRVDEADAQVGRAWSSALDRAITEALARDDGNCVRYRHRREALADVIYRSALRDRSRQWAWQRMALIPRADLPPDEALRCALSEIERQPEGAWPVLMRLLGAEPATAAFTAALRALGGSLVPQLLRLSPRSAAYLDLGAEPPSQMLASEAVASDRTDPAWSAAALDLIHWAHSRAAWAQRHRNALAPLLAAIAWPASGVAAEVRRLRLNRARTAIDAEVRSTAGRDLPTRSSLVPTPALAAAIAAPAQDPASAPAAIPPEPMRPPELPALPTAAPPELPSAETGHPTRWGGALFWLTRLGAAWLELEAPPELALLLRETALALGVPADDAVLAAFCGGELPDGEAPPGVAETARAMVAGWAAWLQTAAPELPEPRVAAVCQRSGRLTMEPGWITLHLPFDAVDTAIRRLGLDLDPGWLPWLGCVVKICYDDA
jgi:hypothetical protein